MRLVTYGTASLLVSANPTNIVDKIYGYKVGEIKSLASSVKSMLNMHTNHGA